MNPLKRKLDTFAPPETPFNQQSGNEESPPNTPKKMRKDHLEFFFKDIPFYDSNSENSGLFPAQRIDPSIWEEDLSPNEDFPSPSTLNQFLYDSSAVSTNEIASTSCKSNIPSDAVPINQIASTSKKIKWDSILFGRLQGDTNIKKAHHYIICQIQTENKEVVTAAINEFKELILKKQDALLQDIPKNEKIRIKWFERIQKNIMGDSIINEVFRSPLHTYIENKIDCNHVNRDYFKFLLEDIGFKKAINSQFETGITPFLSALQSCNFSVIKKLMKYRPVIYKNFDDDNFIHDTFLKSDLDENSLNILLSLVEYAPNKMCEKNIYNETPIECFLFEHVEKLNPREKLNMSNFGIPLEEIQSYSDEEEDAEISDTQTSTCASHFFDSFLMHFFEKFIVKNHPDKNKFIVITKNILYYLKSKSQEELDEKTIYNYLLDFSDDIQSQAIIKSIDSFEKKIKGSL